MTQTHLESQTSGSLLHSLSQQAGQLADSVLATVGLSQSGAAKRGMSWEREFRHDTGKFLIRLHLKRTQDGTLKGSYSVQSKGKAAGQHWPLTGTLLRDDSFVLTGTENRVTLRGSLTGGLPRVEEFHNRNFRLSNFTFTRQGYSGGLGNGGVTVPLPATALSRPAPLPGGSDTPAVLTSLPNLPALKEPDFLARLRQVAASVNTSPEIVLAFLNLESGLDPTANWHKSSQYKGLGQIGEAARIDINALIRRKRLPLKQLTSTAELTELSATQQLAYIEIHLLLHMNGVHTENKAAGRRTSLEAVYMAHLGGSARYAQKDTWVAQGSAAYRQNPMDADADGRNTPVEAADTVRGKFTQNFRANLDERSRYLKPTRRLFNGSLQLFYVYDPKYDNGLPLFALDAAALGHTTAPPASHPVPAPPDPSVAPDTLDQLMKFATLTSEYTIQQVRVARQLIALQPQSARPELYLTLQTKTPHHSQRNNLSLGRSVDGDRPGSKIGGVMCNLTSAAMVLEQLGIENPDPEHFPQFEDYLETVRRKFVDARYRENLKAGMSDQMAQRMSYGRFHRTAQEGWGAVLTLMGAEYDVLPSKRSRTFWETTVQSALAKGGAVMFSINGHIVRLQGMDEQGLIVDDPYGRSELLPNVGLDPKDKAGKYKHQPQKSGDDTIWTWASVAEHDMLWIAVVRKKQ